MKVKILLHDCLKTEDATKVKSYIMWETSQKENSPYICIEKKIHSSYLNKNNLLLRNSACILKFLKAFALNWLKKKTYSNKRPLHH